MTKSRNSTRRRMMWLAAGVGLALGVATALGLPDIKRFRKIKKM